MQANDFHLIKAWLPISNDFRRASVSKIDDVFIADIGMKYYCLAMAREAGDRYLIVDSNCSGSRHGYWSVDVKSMTADMWIDKCSKAVKIVVDGDLSAVICNG